MGASTAGKAKTAKGKTGTKVKCADKKAGVEYTRRVQGVNKKWMCPTGYIDNGCTWADGPQKGELQCKRPIAGAPGSAGSDGNAQSGLVRSPFYGDEAGASVAEILLSNGKYADDKGTKYAHTTWITNEAGGFPSATGPASDEQTKRLEGVVFPNAEFVCSPGHWVRQVAMYSKDGWTSNGVYGACYNVSSGTEYPLFDAVSKYFPSNPDAVRDDFNNKAEKDSGFAFNHGVASGIAGRGLESKKTAEIIFNPLANLFLGIGSLFGVKKKLGNFNYFKQTALLNADKGITTMNVWHENNPKRLRALQFLGADGKMTPIVGTTVGMTKSSYTCPPGTVAVGMTPKLARDAANRRNTDLIGISMTCGNPARTQNK